MHFTLTELLTWLPGAALRLPLATAVEDADGIAAATAAVTVDAIATDSRNVGAGCLFVALRGERFDAHDFLAAVQQQGAAVLLVERLPDGLPLQAAAVLVPDTRLALAAIATRWREKFSLPLIAVTGSNGKTTVKEMLASILEAAFGPDRQMATRGNFNNEIGVPLTLLRLTDAHQAAAIELGMNHVGEIAQLTTMAQPTVALVNNAQREHQEFMVSVEAVAQENGAVIAGLPADGIAVFPAGDPYTALWRGLAGTRRCVTFGLSPEADVSAVCEAETFGSRLAVTLAASASASTSASASATTSAAGASRQFGLTLQAAGVHNAMNALAAIACSIAAGIAPDAIVRGLEAFAPVAGRLQRKRGDGGALVIDDTYNANPDSVRAAIDVLAQAAPPRVLVLGDMGEVGTQGPEFHREIGAYARRKGVQQLLTLGELAQYATGEFHASGAVSAAGAGAVDARHFADIDTLNHAAAELASANTTLLVKGSRFMKMERVVRHLASPQCAADQQQHQQSQESH